MLKNGSYKIQDFSTTTESEVKRLKAQVELFWKKEITCYKSYGLQDGMRIVEFGSGPGFFLEKLALEFPNSSITGVEIDPYLAELSSRYLGENSYKSVHVVEKSVMDSGLTDNSYDFVFSRIVFEHLLEPISAAKEVYRILKPGGKAVLIDNDFQFHLITYPEIPELEALYDAYCRSRIQEGGNPRFGRRLPGILKNSGFGNVDMDIIAAHSSLVGDKIFLKSEGVGISLQLVKDGYLKREILDQIAEKWSAVLSAGDHLFFRQLFVGVGEKIDKEDQDNKTVIKDQKVIAASIAKAEFLAADPSEQAVIFETYLRELIAASMEISVSAITGESSIVELGFDSLAAVDVRVCLESDFGIYFSIAEFFEKDFISNISKWLMESYHQKPDADNRIDAEPAEKSNQVKSVDDNLWEEGEI